MSLNKNKCHVHVKINGMVEFKRLFYFILYELNYCHIHCWCKNTRCSRALLCPGADTQQELVPPKPKTTPPRLAHCQLAFSHRVLSSFSDPPSWPLYDYQQLVKKKRRVQGPAWSSNSHCPDPPGSYQPTQLSTLTDRLV